MGSSVGGFICSFIRSLIHSINGMPYLHIAPWMVRPLCPMCNDYALHPPSSPHHLPLAPRYSQGPAYPPPLLATFLGHRTASISSLHVMSKYHRKTCTQSRSGGNRRSTCADSLDSSRGCLTPAFQLPDLSWGSLLLELIMDVKLKMKTCSSCGSLVFMLLRDRNHKPRNVYVPVLMSWPEL